MLLFSAKKFPPVLHHMGYSKMIIAYSKMNRKGRKEKKKGKPLETKENTWGKPRRENAGKINKRLTIQF